MEQFLVWWETAPIGIWWESNPLTHLFFSPEILIEAFPVILKAFPVSVTFGVVSFVIGIPLGLGLAFMKMSRTRWLRWPATLYVDVVRGTPLFLQILLVFFGLPLMPFWKSMIEAFPWMNQAGLFGVSWSLWLRGFLVLSFNSAAYLCEIFRAGIQSIPRGQMEAARSLGMNAIKAMSWVIIPQTVRRILPTLMSEFILLFKDTALLTAVGIGEMVLRAREVAAATFNPSPYLLAATFYLLLTVPLGRLVARLEDRLAQSEGRGAPPRPPLDLDKIDSEHVVSIDEPAAAN